MTGEKGVLLEVDGEYGVVLTSRGEFKRIRLKYPAEPGCEVPIPEPNPVTRWWRSGLVAAAAVLLLLLAPTFWPALAPSRTVAFVAVDINPSLEMAVDQRAEVLAASALNPDGLMLLQGLNWKGRLVDEVINDVASRAADLGYLPADGGALVITATPVSPGRHLPRNIEGRIEQARNRAVEVLARRKLPATVQTLTTDAAIREEAKSLGISPGRYAILLEARQAGLDLTVEDLRVNRIVKAIKEAGGIPGEIIGRAHEEDNFRELHEKFKERIRSEKDRRGPKRKIGPPANREKAIEETSDTEETSDRQGVKEGSPGGEEERREEKHEEKGRSESRYPEDRKRTGPDPRPGHDKMPVGR